MNKIDDPLKRAAATVVDKGIFVFYLCLKFFGKKTPYKIPLDKLTFKKILVIRLDHIGDVLITTPIYKALRIRYPKARIDTMIGSWSQAVLDHNQDVDCRIIYDAPWWREVRSDQSSSGKGPWEEWRLLWKKISYLRKECYDLVIDPRADFRHIFFFGYLAGGAHILSFDRSGGNYLLSQSLPFQPRVHEMEKNCVLLSVLGIKDVDRVCRTVISSQEEQFADAVIREHGLTGRDIVIISPGARKVLKLWPGERFCELTRWLLGAYSQSAVVFVGGKGEESISQMLNKNLAGEPGVLNLIGKTNLLETYALLKRSHLIITHDGPVSHLASALPVPMIVLFGPTDAERFKPLRADVEVISKKYECSPCLLKTCLKTHSSLKPECMEAISVEDVKKRVEHILVSHS